MMWIDALKALCAGGTCSAAAFLTLMEPESDDTLDSAFEYLVENKIEIDLSDLPKAGNIGQAAARLSREEKLAAGGDLLGALEETDPLRLYLEEIAATPAQGDPEVLAMQCAQGDAAAPEKLANAMLSQVVEIAREFTGRGVLLLDLCQEGGLALWQAILNYRGGSFRELFEKQVRQAMSIEVIAQARSSGIGQKLRQGMEDYRDMDQQLLSELGRNPTTEEIAERLHITEEEALTLKSALDSAQLRRRVDDARAPKEVTADDQQAVENTAYFQSRQRILELLSSLTEEDTKLISLRFGLDGKPPLSPEQTADRLGITPEQVIERETAALAALRGEHTNA